MDLPTELLRTLVAFVDSGSLAGAGQRVGRSEAAVSLHLKRLQALVGRALLKRTGRHLVLTESGWTLLGHARLILKHTDAAIASFRGTEGVTTARLGIVQDWVDPLLIPLLKVFRQAEPQAQPGIVVGSSRDLLAALGEERIDVALCVAGVGGPRPVRREPMCWFGNSEHLGSTLLPLVLVSQPCPFREASTRALDRIQRPFRIALETPSLEGVRAGVAAGIGIGCRTRSSLAGRFTVLEEHTGLPELPDIGYAVLRRPGLAGAGATLGDLAEEMLKNYS